MAEENEVIENNPFIITNGNEEDTANGDENTVDTSLENNPFVLNQNGSTATGGSTGVNADD